MKKFLFQGELFQCRSQNTVPALADQSAASAVPDDHQVVVTDRDAITGHHILLIMPCSKALMLMQAWRFH